MTRQSVKVDTAVYARLKFLEELIEDKKELERGYIQALRTLEAQNKQLEEELSDYKLALERALPAQRRESND